MSFVQRKLKTYETLKCPLAQNTKKKQTAETKGRILNLQRKRNLVTGMRPSTTDEQDAPYPAQEGARLPERWLICSVMVPGRRLR